MPDPIDENLDIDGIRKVKGELDSIRAQLKYPAHHSNTIFSGANAANVFLEVSLEKELLIGLRGGTPIKKIGNMWDTCNIDADPLRSGILTSLFCRVGTKYSNLWGLDVLILIYKTLVEYNIVIARRYIESVGGVLGRFNPKGPEYLEKFNGGLALINIQPVGPVGVAAGGSRRYQPLTFKRKSKKSTKTRKSNRIRKQHGGNPEYARAIVGEYIDDVINVIDLYRRFNNNEDIQTKVLDYFNKIALNIDGNEKQADEFEIYNEIPESILFDDFPTSNINIFFPTFTIIRDSLELLIKRDEVGNIISFNDNIPAGIYNDKYGFNIKLCIQNINSVTMYDINKERSEIPWSIEVTRTKKTYSKNPVLNQILSETAVRPNFSRDDNEWGTITPDMIGYGNPQMGFQSPMESAQTQLTGNDLIDKAIARSAAVLKASKERR
jgi:hypothetical protein